MFVTERNIVAYYFNVSFYTLLPTILPPAHQLITCVSGISSMYSSLEETLTLASHSPNIITYLKRENRMQMKLAFTNFNCVIILIMTVQCNVKYKSSSSWLQTILWTRNKILNIWNILRVVLRTMQIFQSKPIWNLSHKLVII